HTGLVTTTAWVDSGRSQADGDSTPWKQTVYAAETGVPAETTEISLVPRTGADRSAAIFGIDVALSWASRGTRSLEPRSDQVVGGDAWNLAERLSSAYILRDPVRQLSTIVLA